MSAIGQMCLLVILAVVAVLAIFLWDVNHDDEDDE